MGFFGDLFKGIGTAIEVGGKVNKAMKSTPQPEVCEWCGKRPEGQHWHQNSETDSTGETQYFGFFCSEKCRVEALAAGKKGTPYRKGWGKHIGEFGNKLWTGNWEEQK